uniref:endosome-associated-trafficking regulator 1 isoform X5 n=1 Tax=Callithrix jacchus TaxID=9483 RepID=UPI0023DD3D15|nr:endosome-associated-trafficking regulator 1 isoform X5 [Callithrix jacchus]
MSGYPRRLGATPLSRARSIVIPDAPAFFERRSCLPHLDCERPHGRDLDSPFFGIRPAFMCYVPSLVLASVGDTDDKFEDLEEANPFSFKEFLKTKNLGLSKEDPASRIYAKLKDENSKLRRKLNEVQSFSEAQTEMVRTLERKLEAKMIKEESDYHDLESVVQQVEQNLELMTKRAVKAENHVMKLKQEVNLLQAQVSNFQRENEALRCGQGASLTVVKQNANIALQNLRGVMSGAQASIKQLVSGAETLNLVVEILKSIDRISEITDEEDP